ncbi:MAG: hypothetical protein ABIQ38_08680 [Ilumatobacteraceae bacterium]
MMKRFLFVCVSGLLCATLLSGCSSSDDSTSNTTGDSVSTVPDRNIVITAEQAATLIGKFESDAEAQARANGWVWRVGRRDGEQFAVTEDYCECRVTVSIDGSIVTEAVVG